jgi:hypothetical protein
MSNIRRGRRVAKVLGSLIISVAFRGLPSAQAQTITSVTALSDPAQKSNSMHISEISGSGFLNLGTVNAAVQVYLAPSDGVTNLQAQILSDTLIEAHFTAGPDYVLRSVVLAQPAHAALSYVVPVAACKKDDVDVKYEIIPWDQAKNALGNGIAKNFHVVQLSIVNACASKILVPLAGISVVPVWHPDASAACTGDKTKAKCKYLAGPDEVAPFNVDHVTSIFNSDRTSTGSRALIFNVFQGLATLGSAIQPFFGPGFTQGVAIFGGGFRTAALQVSPDMSSQELKALTGQSFEGSETVGANGTPPVQKFIFIPRNEVKLPTGQRQRVDDIKTLNVVWLVVTDTANTAPGVKNPASVTNSTK